MKDNFFQEIGNTKPFLNIGMEGFAGSGKTYTAALLAIGLHKHIKSTKPILAFDSEKAIHFLKPKFDEAGIKVLVRESRTLADLKEVMRCCREGMTDILLIDSISHVWQDCLSSYLLKLKSRGINRDRFEFQDWNIIKPLWEKEFSTPFVLDKYHKIMCGRAGDTYENEIDEETGKRTIFKSGIKMKVEKDTAYEPDFLFLMEQEQQGSGIERKIIHNCIVIKDRTDSISQVTENPTFETFLPAIKIALKDGVELNISKNEEETVDLFEMDEFGNSKKITKKILLEKIVAEMKSAYPSKKDEHLKAKVDLLEKYFGTKSWIEIEERMSLDNIKAGYLKVKEHVANLKQPMGETLNVLEEALDNMVDKVTKQKPSDDGDIPI